MKNYTNWIYDETNVDFASAQKLLIVGPTGSGKTTFSRYICNKWPTKFSIIKNYTTRKKRDDDQDDFKSVSENEFNNLIKNKEFFIFKTKSTTLYGYKKTDYKNIIENRKIPIFMFRFSGLNDLKYNLKNYLVIFIKIDQNKAINHSLDKSNINISNEILTTINDIEQVINEFKKIDKKFFVIENDYTENFFVKINQLISSYFSI